MRNAMKSYTGPTLRCMWTRNPESAFASSEKSVFEFIAAEGRHASEQSVQLAYPLLFESVADVRETSRRLASSTGPLPNDSQRTQRFFDYASRNNGNPTASYVGLAASLEEGAAPPEVEYHLLPFLNTYEVAISSARSKTYHWQRLLMPFHPVEPDILSVLSVANGWFKRRKITLGDLIREAHRLPFRIEAPSRCPRTDRRIGGSRNMIREGL